MQQNFNQKQKHFFTFQPKQKNVENIDWELLQACRDGNLQDVKLLLAAGANVNAKFDETPLTISAEKGHIEVVRFLLDSGANINETDNDG